MLCDVCARWFCGRHVRAFNDRTGETLLCVECMTAPGLHPQVRNGSQNSHMPRKNAESSDSLGNGILPETADPLVQRFKAMKGSVEQGSCENSPFSEPILRGAEGLTSQQERMVA